MCSGRRARILHPAHKSEGTAEHGLGARDLFPKGAPHRLDWRGALYGRGDFDLARAERGPDLWLGHHAGDRLVRYRGHCVHRVPYFRVVPAATLVRVDGSGREAWAAAYAANASADRVPLAEHLRDDGGNFRVGHGHARDVLFRVDLHDDRRGAHRYQCGNCVALFRSGSCEWRNLNMAMGKF